MKVCTDACLFGAIIAHSQPPSVNCLDIGTGTGLLSLMYAQKDSSAIIEAVELDEDAAFQARENFMASSWKDRLHVFNSSILAFAPGKKYGLIISNPPFFEDDLRSASRKKNNAKHDTGLSLTELADVANRFLSENGRFAVLLPYRRIGYFIEEAGKHGLRLHQKILVKPAVTHNHFRGVLIFGREEAEVRESVISITDSNNDYTKEFTELLRDYYLYL